MFTRRTLLKTSMLSAGALLATSERASSQTEEDFIPPPSPAVAPFARRLPIPRLHLPLNRPDATTAERARAWDIHRQALNESRFQHYSFSPDDPVDYYEVTAMPGVASIIPGLRTPVWGYNGHYPGPTFIAKRDRTMVVRHVNRVAEVTSMHYHGGHTPPDSDGTPMLGFTSSTKLTSDGLTGSRTYVYPNDNEFPATLWYHDHGFDLTGPNVYRGLAGFFLLTPGDRDADWSFREVDRALPSGYGRYDIPMLFQDRRFNADGSLFYDTFDHDGFLGDRFLVNGAVQPYLPVARRKYRFRWLNGSNARVYQLALSSGEPLTQIATEGALLEQPVARGSIRIAPAQRYEVVVDFKKYPLGSKVYLVNRMLQTQGGKPDGLVSLGSSTKLIEFRVERDEDDPSTVPSELNPELRDYVRRYLDPDRPLDPTTPIPVRDLLLSRVNGAWAINERFFDRRRVDVTERLNTQSIWRLVNDSGGWVHPIHIHDMEFLILDINGRPPSAGEAGLKDVFYVGEHETVRLMAYWSGPKNIGQYVFHCHNLEHEDMSMMGIFEVKA